MDRVADFEAGVWSVFSRCCFVEVMKLNLGLDSEASYVWSRFLNLSLVEILMFGLRFLSDPNPIIGYASH